jgi:predicted glycoside hydrolase/deacetylase ChbG (UPF0249 family)
LPEVVLKKKLSLLLALVLSLELSAQQNPIRLIIRGDDLGSSHSANSALIKSYNEGIEKTVEVMVVTAWFPEAVKLLKENPGLDVGVHLTITSEWENVKWRPLTNCPSLTDASGYFFPMISPNANYPGQAIKENNWKIEEIEKEFRAQIELAKKSIPWVSHFTSHMGCTRISEEVKKMTKRLVQEYNIDIDLEELGAKSVYYDGPNQTSSEKVESFIKMLNKLETGNTYMFLDHPGLDNDELRAVYHIGYENVAQDRQGVTDVFTSEKVKRVINERGIQLISYKDILEK